MDVDDAQGQGQEAESTPAASFQKEMDSILEAAKSTDKSNISYKEYVAFHIHL